MFRLGDNSISVCLLDFFNDSESFLIVEVSDVGAAGLTRTAYSDFLNTLTLSYMGCRGSLALLTMGQVVWLGKRA
jgi:hypothetical protein